MLIGNRNRRAPVGRTRARPLAKSSRVRRDRYEYVLARSREAGKAVVALGLIEERTRERKIGGKGDDREAASIEAPCVSGLRGGACWSDERREQSYQCRERQSR